MTVPAAENSYKKGLASLIEGRHPEAASFFRAAMRIEKQHGVGRPDMRYLSYYGLTLARAHRVTMEALEACEHAVKHDPKNPTLMLNLGRLHLLSGRVDRALECLERGLRLAPGHAALTRELATIDRRGKPVIPGLGRSHPLNQRLGRLRASVASRLPEWMTPRGTRTEIQTS